MEVIRVLGLGFSPDWGTHILQTLVGRSMPFITKYFWFPYDFFSSEILKNAVVSKNKIFHFVIFFQCVFKNY